MSKKTFFLDAPGNDPFSPKNHYALLPIPYENTVSYGCGTAKGPLAIINASQVVDFFDEELKIPLDVDIQTLPAIKCKGIPEQKALKSMYSSAYNEMKKKRFLLSLGGEHTVSAPLVKAARDAFGEISVLQLDAHSDLRDEFHGSKFSHACVMRRIRDEGIKTVHVGIRSCCTEEYDHIQSNMIPIFWANEIMNQKRKDWIDEVIRQLSEKVYLTIDVDVFDPSLVPGTGTPEPGGLMWYDVISLVREVIKRRNVVSADIVETAPFKGSQVSEYVAARLGARLLMYHKHRDSL